MSSDHSITIINVKYLHIDSDYLKFIDQVLMS